jgi:hypothetical protein
MKNNDLTRLEHKLKKLSDVGFNIAVMRVLNGAAFAARSGYQSRIASELTNRNTYTVRSVRVERASRNALEARTGSVATYMARAEEGGATAITGGHRPIATNAAAGRGRATEERTRLPLAKFSMRGLTIDRLALRAYHKPPNQRARNAAAVRGMAKRGGGVIYMNTAKGRGLFNISGSAAAPRVDMIYSLRRRTVVTPPHDLLRGATARARVGMATAYRDELRRQLAWGS